MRRAITALVATVVGLVLLLSFKTGSAKSSNRPVALSGATAGNDTGNDGADDSNSTSTPSPAPSSTGPTSSPTATAKAAGTQTITGSSVRVSEGFRTFGSVQVQVTLTNGKITKLVAVDYPNNDPQSSEISQYSIPVLTQEVLAAQGTKIDIVSGATYTSDAYAQSVQAALDKAKS
jgi:uncharacterized protein with FMN-binding domain